MPTLMFSCSAINLIFSYPHSQVQGYHDCCKCDYRQNTGLDIMQDYIRKPLVEVRVEWNGKQTYHEEE